MTEARPVSSLEWFRTQEQAPFNWAQSFERSRVALPPAVHLAPRRILSPANIYFLQEGVVGSVSVDENGHKMYTEVIEGPSFCGYQENPDSSFETLTHVTTHRAHWSSFERFLNVPPQEAHRKILQFMAERVRQKEIRMSQLINDKAQRRIARMIHQLTRHDPFIYMTEEETAALAATSRQTINQTMNEFMKRGLVAKQRELYTVLNPSGVEEMIHSSE